MANGRIYTAAFEDIAVTAAQDLFELNAPADAVVEVMEFHIAQTNIVGDSNEEQLSIQFKSGQTTSGSVGGGAVTASPLSLGDTAFGGSVERNNTTVASGGTIVTHATWVWNLRVPLDIIFQPETRKILSPSARATFELGEAPAASTTMSGYIVFSEIGG